MRQVFKVMLMFHLSTLIEAISGSTYYKREKTKILADFVIKRFADTSAVSCLIQCRANKNCDLAAIQETDCLFLNVSQINSGGKKLYPVTLLKEIDTSPKIPGQGSTIVSRM